MNPAFGKNSLQLYDWQKAGNCAVMALGLSVKRFYPPMAHALSARGIHTFTQRAGWIKHTE